MRVAGGALLLLLLAAVPPLLGDFQVFLLTQSLIWGIFALSMGLLLGFVGQINLGQAAFVALSAYASTLLRLRLGLSFWLAAPLTLALVVAVAVLVGLITLRLRGPYFVLVMLGFGEVVRLLIANWQDLTGGMVGLRGIQPPESLLLLRFDTRLGFYYLVLAATAAAALGLAGLVRSRLGRVLVAIREDEVLAEFAGAPLMRSKVTALAISAFVAGLGGLLVGPFLSVLSPNQFTVFASVDMIVMVVVGGAGTLAGPLLGAVFLTYVPELFGFLRDLRPILMGGLLVAVTLFLPGGLVGALARLAPGGRPPRPALGRGEADPGAGRAMPGDGPLLDVAGLGKRFAGVQAVSDVSFSVAAGEILGLIGPNGAGKTTTFNLISGFHPPSTGRVTLAGRVLTGLRPDQVADAGLSRTFQGTRTFPKLTVAENLRLPFLARSRVGFWASWLRLGAGRVLDAEADRGVAEVLDFTGLAPDADTPADSLPYARQSLLGIGLALAGRPRLLLLDEPFAGMNPGETAAAARTVRRIRDRGITVLLVEHDMHAVMSICDRIVVLDGGRKLIEGTPDVVRRDRRVIEAYLGTDDDA